MRVKVIRFYDDNEPDWEIVIIAKTRYDEGELQDIVNKTKEELYEEDPDWDYDDLICKLEEKGVIKLYPIDYETYNIVA